MIGKMNLQRARRRVLAVAAWVLFWNHVGVVRANEKDDGTDGDPMMTMTTDVDVNQTNNDSPPQKICFNGYVMDYYCIGRGTLLDAPSRNTLEYPDRHSIHCLVRRSAPWSEPHRCVPKKKLPMHHSSSASPNHIVFF
mmetsp:Transcript_3720/g.8024  ORF Transcript_3720/g.8024 Transcript_3720/m.8024 type:complete len:138 (+) Transcript_3720:222-635(+)